MPDKEMISKYQKINSMMSGASHGNIRTYLEHHKRVKDFLDAYKTRAASVEFRKNVLDYQRKQNYQLEYDRIRSEMGKSVLPHETALRLKKREKELQKLGAKAINTISDLDK